MFSFDPSVLLANLTKLAQLIQDGTLVIGIGFVVGGVLVFKRYGEMRGIMSHQMTIGRPLMLVLGGAALISIPSMATLFAGMLFGSSSPLSMQGINLGEWDTLMQSVVVLVRLIGFLALARGLCILSKTGSQSQTPGAIGRGCIFVVAGILCIHILGTISLLQYTLGVV
jgi:intracellular multiplication protein IcmC